MLPWMHFSLSPSPLCNYNVRCHSAEGRRSRKRKERVVSWCSYASLPLALSPWFWAPLLVNKQCLPLASITSLPNSSTSSSLVSLLFHFHLSHHEQHPWSWHLGYILPQSAKVRSVLDSSAAGRPKKTPQSKHSPQGSSHEIPLPCTDHWELFPPPPFG